MFANYKNFTIFAPQQLFNGSVNHRIYHNKDTRIGVMFPYSYSTAMSDCCNFGSITLSLLLVLIKFFTNATIGKKFSTREGQYLITNAQPSDRAIQSTSTKRQPSTPTLLPAIGLLLRELRRDVRHLPAQVAQNRIQRLWHRHTIRPDQRQGFLCQGRDLPTGIPAPNGTTAPVSATGSLYGHRLRLHLFPFINY